MKSEIAVNIRAARGELTDLKGARTKFLCKVKDENTERVES
jgi:hypothetical protein